MHLIFNVSVYNCIICSNIQFFYAEAEGLPFLNNNMIAASGPSLER